MVSQTWLIVRATTDDAWMLRFGFGPSRLGIGVCKSSSVTSHQPALGTTDSIQIEKPRDRLPQLAGSGLPLPGCSSPTETMYSVARKPKAMGTKKMLLLRRAEGQHLGKCCRKQASKERVTKHCPVIHGEHCHFNMDEECSPGAPSPSVETAAFKEAQRHKAARRSQSPGDICFNCPVGRDAAPGLRGLPASLGGCAARVHVSTRRSPPHFLALHSSTTTVRRGHGHLGKQAASVPCRLWRRACARGLGDGTLGCLVFAADSRALHCLDSSLPHLLGHPARKEFSSHCRTLAQERYGESRFFVGRKTNYPSAGNVSPGPGEGGAV